MRGYELGLILHPDVEQADVTKSVERISEYIQSDEGSVTSVDVWGRRPLAYPIQKQLFGSYVFLNIQLDTQAIGELERKLKLDEEVLRHMFVRLDD